MKTKAGSRVIFTICVLLIAAFSYIGVYGLNVAGYRVQSFGEVLKRGLDLQGGVSVLQEIQSKKTPSRETLERTKELLSVRVNKLGVSETAVSIEGKNRIRVDIPGKYDSGSINEMLTKSGKLTFVGPDNKTILTGKDVKSAKAYTDDYGKYAVSLELNASGKKKFSDATKKFLGQTISIKMDNEDVTTPPTVESQITNGVAEISGSFTLQKAKELASIIQSGALPVTLKNVETKTVGPTIGEVGVPMSVRAGLVGISLVFLFMLIYYRIPGLLADLALTVFILLVFSAFNVLNVVLTLPGIAGLLLTIGMAVDANVLIFERTKEELRLGKSVRSSVEAGFHRALSSIVDSNVTTIIAGLVLYVMGSGSVKGFALTLVAGTLISMFTAITVTRTLLNLWLNMGIMNKPVYFGVKRG
ncbi:protein translocase subunit SecD [Clostridium oryzae]|uniref:Protein translocase subunit SecD n=1 Tax=Clostridium oryzae TaxID=1450648 RepID=A0A1V4IU84_9CLOT|nr:protein translocase subunit SecD [Clostridium oryzae]OPJ63582.1 protein translocase subunit SecD [Clostridium oryzae]